MDSVLDEIVSTLTKKYRCHTVILYGSRSRGAETARSDYDVLGIRARGATTRLAKKKNGFYWDVFVYSEKEAFKTAASRLEWRYGKVLVERGRVGRSVIQRAKAAARKPFKPSPAYEIAILRVWGHKQLDRIKEGDVHALFRRSELQSAAVDHYFELRRKRFWGPKAGLEWIRENDPATYRLFAAVYRNPTSLAALRKLVARVYGVANS